MPVSPRGSDQRGAHLAAARREREAGRELERFHLVFLEVATTELPLDAFVLKGGANLRFFLRSFRRSVDMDFNYVGRLDRFESFTARVGRVFASTALEGLLRVRGIALDGLRIAKRTETTIRWKFSVRGRAVEAASKIEFSARTEQARAEEHELDVIDAELARWAGARPVRLAHYLPVAAIFQKIGALRSRRETQPRDVFDLDHLFRHFPDALSRVQVEAEALRAARDRALELRYEDYASTVRPYLQEEFERLYGTEDTWIQMQLRVSERLEARLAEVAR